MITEHLENQLIEIGKFAVNVRAAYLEENFLSAGEFQKVMDKLIDELIDEINYGDD